jgi:hypothetical protein
MNFDLVFAVIAFIRASAVGAALGGRIYPAAQIPPNALFPRCYIALRQSQNYYSFNKRDGGVDRHQTVDILFAQTVAVSPTAFKDIEGWDKATRALVEWNIHRYSVPPVPDLTSFQRVADYPTSNQVDDLNTYVMGGGTYDAFYQEG